MRYQATKYLVARKVYIEELSDVKKPTLRNTAGIYTIEEFREQFRTLFPASGLRPSVVIDLDRQFFTKKLHI